MMFMEVECGVPHLSYEVYEALPGLGHALLWPVGELELPDGA